MDETTVVALALGCIGTTVFSQWADTFVLTWPASLYVGFRLTVGAIQWAESQQSKSRPRLISRAVAIVFLACGYAYYRICLDVGYAMGWCFLAGFLPATPATVMATRARRLWLRALAELAGFTIYFWFSGFFPTFKRLWFS